MSQRQAFLEGEGDAWFQRNIASVSSKDTEAKDPVLGMFESFPDIQFGHILEVGCGAGQRGAAIAERTGAVVHGIDPSAKAVAHARSLGVDAHVGTADALPFETGMFDLVLFGFCLYLCDRDDLFRIAGEADRVLGPQGWIIVHDFFSPAPIRRPYRHRSGLYSYKMDYRRLFDWHPDYVCLSHHVVHHNSQEFTDEVGEWTATSVLRKCQHRD